jgi:hypothetical protein
MNTLALSISAASGFLAIIIWIIARAIKEKNATNQLRKP